MNRLPFKCTLPALLAGLFALDSACAQGSADPNEGARLTLDPVTGGYDLSWWGRGGITYFIEHSEDLITWDYLPVIESGGNDVIKWGLLSSPGKSFLRLKLTEAPVSGGDPFSADLDGDGTSNWQELLDGTDPFDFYNGAGPVLAIVSGNNQSGLRSIFLPQPLVVQITDANSNPIPNVLLDFTAGSGARLSLVAANGSSLTTTLAVRTQFDGKATIMCYTPAQVGDFTVYVAGTAPGATLTATFHETANGAAVLPPSAPAEVAERQIDRYTYEWTWIDTSDNESEFIIRRKNAAGEWIELGRVGPNATSFRYTVPH